MMNQIKALRYILKSRLDTIDRWEEVDVFHPSEKNRIKKNHYVSDIFDTDEDNFCIIWSKSKSETNHHPFEIKEVPLRDINSVIERNAVRLKNNSKPYK